MKVTYTVRALALVRVFSELHVHVGGRLYMDDLRQEWRRITGLRIFPADVLISSSAFSKNPSGTSS